jgi:hypothetical protein
MIRDFNLFTERSINIVDEDDVLRSSSVMEKNLVEKRFKFPSFADPNGVSVDDLVIIRSNTLMLLGIN